MMNLHERFLYKSLLIRETETEIEDLFSQGLLRGTTHGCRGQEPVPVVLSELLDINKDFVLGGHRSHGLVLAFSDDVAGLVGELMGKQCGYINGRGGSQHLAYKNLFTNGITGGMVPVATGLAFACKMHADSRITATCFGDGAFNEGYVMESFNMASVLNLPLLFILENNSFAMSTPSEVFIGGKIETRIEGFGIKYFCCISTDIEAVYATFTDAINFVRQQMKPAFVEVTTHRFSGHSKSDKREYVPKELDDFWLSNDFIKKLEQKIPNESLQAIQQQVIMKIANGLKLAKDKN